MKIPYVIQLVLTTFKRFNQDKCFTHSIKISYFALLCTVPLVALFTFLTTKLLGNSEVAFRSLDIFSDEFFVQLGPEFFEDVRALSNNITNVGWFGLAGSLIAAPLLFSNLIYAINYIFKANYQKSFFYNRLMEYLVMFIMGIIMLISLFITVIWSAMQRSLKESAFIANHINPKIVSIANNFILQYLLPFTLTFLAFFAIYKFIPEIKVYTKAAVIAAVIGALLWELFKRIFAFYVAHFTIIGIVLSRIMKGTFSSIVFFLIWLSFSLAILLWGAELAYALNERYHEKNA